MFTSNNLSIIDETGRSDVMAAAIPATNKWLLTKQAAVAPSGSRRNDRSESERRAGGGGEGRRSSGVEVIPLSESREGVRGGQGGRGWGRWGGGTWRGVVRATVWSELSAVGQLSAPLSSLRSASHTIYLAVKRPTALALPRPPLGSPCPPAPQPLYSTSLW